MKIIFRHFFIIVCQVTGNIQSWVGVPFSGNFTKVFYILQIKLNVDKFISEWELIFYFLMNFWGILESVSWVQEFFKILPSSQKLLPHFKL